MTVALLTAELAGQAREFERAEARGVEVPDLVDELDEVDVEDFADIPPLIERGVAVLRPKEVLAFLRGKVPLNSRTIESLLKRMREQGVTITEQYRRQLLELLSEVMSEVAEERISLDAKIKRLDERLQEAGLDPAAPRHLETIIRTHTNTAYTAGRLDALDTPELQEAFPYLIYRTVGNGVPGVNAVRPEHAKMHNKAYLRSDRIWNTWTPPNGFNCRCGIVPATLNDLKALGIKPSRVAPKIGKQRVKPDEGFRFNGAEAFRRGGLAGLGKAERRAAKEWIAGQGTSRN